jgi:hypothetical protein
MGEVERRRWGPEAEGCRRQKGGGATEAAGPTEAAEPTEAAGQRRLRGGVEAKLLPGSGVNAMRLPASGVEVKVTDMVAGMAGDRVAGNTCPSGNSD